MAKHAEKSTSKADKSHKSASILLFLHKPEWGKRFRIELTSFACTK